MKTATKIGIGAAAVVTAGALAFATPTFAAGAATAFGGGALSHSAGESAFAHDRGTHIEAELSATVTGVPETVTEVRDAAHGGYWEAFALDAAATALPTTKPTEGGFRIGVHPSRAEDGTVTEPTLTAGVVTGTIDLHIAAADSTEVFALYPSDGGQPVLVTVITDADGVATATASGELTVAYSADVVAEGPAFARAGADGRGGHGGHAGKGGHGPHRGGFEDGITPEDGTTDTDTDTDAAVTPNA